MSLALASRYARAMADLVLDPGRTMDPEAVASEMAVFDEALAGSVELRNVLLSPVVPPPRKRAVVARLARDYGMSRLLRNFLYVLIDHRRTALLAEVRQSFQLIVDERTGAVEAEVAAARDWGETRREEVAGRLGELTGKKVRCKFSVDKGLIGGVRVRIGSTIYDGSVRGQLEALRRTLTE